MKKLLLFLMAITIGASMQSCISDDDAVIYTDHDTYSTVYQLSNVNFEWSNGSWQIYRNFSPALYSYDMVLVYIQNGTTGNGNPIWQQIPITYYLEDGNEVDYNFDFSINDIAIYAGGTFDLAGSPYVLGKTFRILVVPADPPGKTSPVDFSNYQSVIEHYGINDSKVVELN